MVDFSARNLAWGKTSVMHINQPANAFHQQANGATKTKIMRLVTMSSQGGCLLAKSTFPQPTQSKYRALPQRIAFAFGGVMACVWKAAERNSKDSATKNKKLKE
jgi:hypothetical protein